MAEACRVRDTKSHPAGHNGRRTKSRPADRADDAALNWQQYADDVISGRLPSGALARASVLRMQTWAKKKDRYFDKDEVKRVFTLFSLFKHTSGEYGGKPFTLLPWQAWIIAQIFGWRYKANKRRVIRKAYVEVAKKNGKTELAAAIGLIMAFFDGEYGAEVYSAANKLEQAKICWGSAAAMVRFLKKDSAAFDKMVELHDSFNNSKIFRRETNSKFIPIASDSKTLDGLRPNAAIIDEFHESIDDSVLRNLESGMVNRAQPLLFIITTAGFNINGVCYQYRKVVSDIVEGRSEDDSTFGMIFTQDEEDDWQQQSNWQKANPSLGITPTVEAMEIAFQRALNEGQSSEVNFKTKNLNIWVRSAKTWIQDHIWMTCAKGSSESDLQGRRCFAAFDLSSNRDLTAFGLLFPPDDDTGDFVFQCRYFIPAENAEQRVRRDRVPYLDWHKAGLVEFTEGNITDQNRVLEAVVEAAEKYDIENIYYDRWQSTKLATELAEQGARVTPFAQTVTNFNEPIRMIEELIATQRLAHGGDEVLRWMVGNVVVKYWNGLCKFDKDKSREKIDGLVVMAMCFAGYLNWLASNGASIYNDRDLFML